MKMKVCNKCGVQKENEEYHKGRNSCKLCVKEYDRVKYLKNIDTYLKKSKETYYKNPEYQKKWVDSNRDKVNLTSKKWRNNNKEKHTQSVLNSRNKNIIRYNEYMVSRRNNDSLFKLSCNIRNRIGKFLSVNNINKKNKTFELVGVTPIELKEYLEKLFTVGMCWDNYGEWHIDHIIPLSFAKNEEEIYKLCHYTNLQPLWAEENLKKSNKIIN
jgi:flagellar biosynthesis chaperone FliJ